MERVDTAPNNTSSISGAHRDQMKLFGNSEQTMPSTSTNAETVANSIIKPTSLSLSEINTPSFKITNNLDGHSSYYQNDDQNLRDRFESMNINNISDFKNKFPTPTSEETRDALGTQQQIFNRLTPTTTPLNINSLLQQQQQQQAYHSLQKNIFQSMLQNDQLIDSQAQKHQHQSFAGLLPPLQHQYPHSPYDLSPQDLPFYNNHHQPSRYNSSLNNNNNNSSNNFHATTSSPKSEEMKFFFKSLRRNNLQLGSNLGSDVGKKVENDNNNSNFISSDTTLEQHNNNNNNINNINTTNANNNNNNSVTLFENLKLPQYLDNYDQAANSQLAEALLRLKQQNSLVKQQLNENLLGMHLGNVNYKDILNRHFSLNNVPLVDQERLARLYIKELLKDNPSLMTGHLLNSPSLTGGLGPNFGASFTNDHVESYSRKVFVGGLPPDSDENEITASFRQFGPLIVDWPHKAETKTSFPPKGYCFLLFQDEMSVQKLMEACQEDDRKFYWCISSSASKDKPVRRVQIRPWCLVDSDFLMDASQPLDLRKTVFVGGVPRPLKAAELAIAMDQLYGCVCYAGIDTDPELKYPKGAGRVSFSTQQSYISAISARFVQLQFGDIDKRVEVKPYVLDDQLCDECQGQKSAGKSAPYYCANVACLQYYCETCWVFIHSRPGREFHKPLVKEGADRPKNIPPFKW